MSIFESPCVKSNVRWATVSIGRWFLMVGTGRGVIPCKGRYTDVKPFVMASEESGARCTERQGNERWRRAVAGFTLRGEQLTLSAASLCLWVIRIETGGRQNSTESIRVGVAVKQFVAHLGPLCQKVLRQAVVPTLGENRSAP